MQQKKPIKEDEVINVIQKPKFAKSAGKKNLNSEMIK